MNQSAQGNINHIHVKTENHQFYSCLCFAQNNPVVNKGRRRRLTAIEWKLPITLPGTNKNAAVFCTAAFLVNHYQRH
jgi:hypothetical protein